MNYYKKESRKYLKNILNVLKTADLWVLDQVYRACVNITRTNMEGGESE